MHGLILDYIKENLDILIPVGIVISNLFKLFCLFTSPSFYGIRFILFNGPIILKLRLLIQFFMYVNLEKSLAENFSDKYRFILFSSEVFVNISKKFLIFAICSIVNISILGFEGWKHIIIYLLSIIWLSILILMENYMQAIIFCNAFIIFDFVINN